VCTSNIMVPCTAKVHVSPCWPCNQGFYCTGSKFIPEYYHNDPCRVTTWDSVNLSYGSGPGRPHLVRSAAMPLADDLELDIKNAALEALQTRAFQDGSPNGVRFDRLDHAQGNGNLDYYSRTYDGSELPCESLTSVYSLSGSHTYYRGRPIEVDVAIRRAKVELSIVPHRVCHRDAYYEDTGGGQGHFILCDYRLYPHCRFKMWAELVLRVNLPGQGCTLNPHGLADPIVYADATGRPLLWPLKQVEWWGYLGHYSVPSVENVVSHEPAQGTLRHECAAWAMDLSGTQIPGWPYLSAKMPEAPAQVYGGSVRLDFNPCDPGLAPPNEGGLPSIAGFMVPP